MSDGLLSGIRIIELGGVGPGPYAGMQMADMGAEVIRVDPVSAAGTQSRFPILERGKRSIAVDLESDEGRDILLRLTRESDAVLEGFRPGVLERLGLGPAEFMRQNPKLVLARVTGWGQHGPRPSSSSAASGPDPNSLSAWLLGRVHSSS